MNAGTRVEKYIEDYPIPITLESTEIILSQMKSSVCKIYLDNGNKGTGFFCKVPFPGHINLRSFLVTNNHVIHESYLRKDKSFEITINNDKIKKRLTIGNRIVYTSKIYDTTIIGIDEDKDNIKDFLQLDFNLNEGNFNNKYINKSIYTLHYQKDERIAVSYGIIKSIDLTNNYSICHLCSTDIGSSGSPILNVKTNKLIGIHKGSSDNANYNKGTLLIYPFKELISQKKVNDFLINSNNPEMIEAIKIIKEEFIFLINNPITNIGCSVGLKDKNNIFEWQCSLVGAKDSLYRDGIFFFEIKFPYNYPKKPPEVVFKTPIYHVNINPYKSNDPKADPLGLLNLSSLKMWKPEYKIAEFLANMFALFYIANSDNSYGLERAYELRYQKQLYENKIKYFTKKYANPNIANKEYNVNWDFTYPCFVNVEPEDDGVAKVLDVYQFK